MRVVLLHSPVAEPARPDEEDTLVQVRAISAALAELGHEAVPLACTLDLGRTAERLRALGPDRVFNLVESIDGTCRLLHLAGTLLEHLGIPCTGSPPDGLYLTTGKPLTKKLLAQHGLPTPAWITAEQAAQGAPLPGGRLIVKSTWEHASMGLDDGSLLEPASTAELAAEIERRSARLGGSCFAEQFIAGREFNLSVLERAGGPEVLPCAEIVFDSFPEEKPRLVGYEAKWSEDSFEYRHTARRFEFPPEDSELLSCLTRIAIQCFRLFELGGYARVDFRVDASGQPYVLEVNTNPCLSPDAGYAAAAREAGLTYPALIDAILAAAWQRPGPRPGERGAGPEAPR